MTELEILQEARRVLRRLAAPRAVLFARGGRHMVARSAASASRVTVAADCVAAFLARGWIAPDGPGRHVLAPAGRALLLRDDEGFGAQHRLMEDTAVPGEDKPLKLNAAESPLARLKFRGLVSDLQFAAGERLRRDFTLAQLTPRMGVDWSAPVVMGSRGGGDNLSDVAIAARQRFNRALAAAGVGLSDLLFDVCCHLTPLEAVESGRGWSRSSGRAVLGIALDRLATHYGFDVVAKSAQMRAWTAMEEG